MFQIIKVGQDYEFYLERGRGQIRKENNKDRIKF